MKKQLFYNLFLFKIILKISPLRILFVLFMNVFDVAVSFFYNVIFVKYQMDFIQYGAKFSSMVYLYAIALVFTLTKSVLHDILTNRVVAASDQDITRAVQTMIFNKIKTIDVSCYDDPAFYNDYVMSLNEFENRVIKVWQTIDDLFRGVLSAAVFFAFIAALDPIAVLFSIIPLVVSFFIGLRTNKLYFRFKTDIIPHGRIIGFVRRVFYLKRYADELHTSNIGTVLINRLNKASEELKAIIRKYVPEKIVLGFIFSAINCIFSNVGIGLYLCYKIMIKRTLSIGGFVSLISAAANFTNEVKDILNTIPKFNENALYAKKVYELLHYENKVVGGDDSVPSAESGYTIELKNVSFRYTENDDYVLRHVNMKLKKGEKIAIVGENGAGKTTLVKLLLRFYDPTEGEILLNGQNIRAFDLDEYRAIYNAVFQDFQVYATAVAENVLMRPFEDADEAAVRRSLTESRLELGDIQANLTREFDEQGIVLSGGQTQKLAIARVFANTDRGVIILDEPSSALDPISEYHIIKQINERFADKSIVFISHRLATTRDVDHIYLLGGGQVIEDGSHGELMAKRGIYADMFSKQAEKFRE